MTSQISMRKLLKLEFKQNAWMLALSSLAQFMAGPVMFLLSVSDSYSTTAITVSRHCGYIGETYFFAQIFMIILSICFTIFSYRYLFSKRMVDLYHSAPISRGKLFWVKYIHGFLVWFIPFLVFSILLLLLSFARLNTSLTLAYMGMLTLNYLKTLLLSFFCFFIFYHLYLVAVYLSGNVLNMFTNVAIIGFCIVCLYGLGLSCAECYFDTFCTTPSGVLMDALFALSPFVAPFYIYICYEEGGLAFLFTGHPTLLIVSLVLCVALLFLAKKLYNKRPSELAERGTTNKWYATAAKLAVSFVASIAFALFFGELVYGSSGLFWGIFGAIFGGILCYGAVNSIFHTTIKAFFKNMVQMIAVTAGGILFLLAFQLDWFGYDNYLPAKENIAGVAIYSYSFSDGTQNIEITNNSSDSLGFSYGTTSQRVTQKQLLTDKDICYDFLDLAINGPANQTDSNNYTSYYVKVALENGRTYYRRYRIYDSDYEVLKPFIESEEYKNTNYKLSAGLMGYPDNVELYLQDAHISLTMSDDNIKELMDAYWQDFEEHYTMEELASYMSTANLELYYVDSDGMHHYFNLLVPDFYTHTMEYLKSLYPDYFPYITSPDQIISLEPYMSKYMYEEYGGFANYYEMEGAETPQWLKDAMEQDSGEQSLREGSEEIIVLENTASGTATIAQIENITITMGTGSGEITITDPEMIELIFPYLYFGEYNDSLGFRDYIYFASVRTSTSNYISCYVKPNTVPQEILDFLEANVTVEISKKVSEQAISEL